MIGNLRLFEEIVNATARAFDIDPWLIMSRRRGYVSRARAVVVAVARAEMQMSYPRIGRALGIDHTAALYADRRIAQSLRNDEIYGPCPGQRLRELLFGIACSARAREAQPIIPMEKRELNP